jgi:phospholipase C
MDALPHRTISRLAGVLLLTAGQTFSTCAGTGTIRDVRHVVILTLENRSFDHYYGCLGGVRGFSDRNALLLTNGQPVFYQPQPNGFILPFHSPTQCLGDVAHDEATGLLAWDSGWCDEWLAAKGTNSMAYFTREDLSYYYALADAYTICDEYYCSVLGPTYPNRLYLMTGMVDPNRTGGGPVLANVVPTNGFNWTTYPERLQKAGINWRVYQPSSDYFPINALVWFSQYLSASPGNPLYDRGIALVPDVVGAFQSDVSNGTLPSVSWILPGASSSEHPCNSPASGAALTKRLLDALASNPEVCNSTVFFLTYDENGGFFDHVPSPVPPPGTPDEFVNGQPIGLGVRVPMLIVSPWTRGGHVCSQVFDHTSLLRFLETWTGVAEPNISSWRRQVCGDLTSAFDFSAPNTNFPALPTVAPVICTGGINPPAVPQIAPAQESGFRPSRAAPYQPNARCRIDCTSGRLWIELTNAGHASVHFAVYPNNYCSGPWQYDVAPNGFAIDSFLVSTNPSGVYDFACYGPKGFHRRFAGSLGRNCGQLELSSSLDLDAAGLNIVMSNSSAVAVEVTVSNALQAGDVRSYTISPAGTTNDLFLAVTNNLGSYDLTATTTVDPLFVRRFAGHIETGPPRIRAAWLGGQLRLSYPGWAAGYNLESVVDLTTGLWQPVNNSTLTLNNRVFVTVPTLAETAYFRLRR